MVKVSLTDTARILEDIVAGEVLDRRDSPRGAVMLAATVHDAGQSGAVKVRNLSSSGALVEGEALPRAGASVLFGRNGQLLRSHVVWADGSRGGIRFDQPLEFEACLRRVTRPNRAPVVRARRPGLSCKPLTAGDKRTWERWVSMGPSALGD